MPIELRLLVDLGGGDPIWPTNLEEGWDEESPFDLLSTDLQKQLLAWNHRELVANLKTPLTPWARREDNARFEGDRRVVIDLVQAELDPRYRVVPGNGRTM